MAIFCRECGSKLVNGRCVRPGCPNYSGEPAEGGNAKMEPGGFSVPNDAFGSSSDSGGFMTPGDGSFEVELPDSDPSGFGGSSANEPGSNDFSYPGDNAGPGGFGYPGDNAGPGGFGYPGDNAGSGGFGYPGDNAGSDGFGYPGDNARPGNLGYSGGNAGPSGFGYPGDNAGPGNPGYPGDNAGPGGFGYPGRGGTQRGGFSSEDLQRKLSDAGKTANDAIKDGIDKFNQGYEKTMTRERSITDGTGSGFTGTGDQTITGIKLVKDEKMVRTYHCTTYGLIRKKEGYITVTNKRVIFESVDTTSRVANEVVLDGVTGFRNYYGLSISPALLVTAFILGMSAVSLFGTGLNFYGGNPFILPSIIMLMIAGACGFFAFKRSVVVSVFSSKASGTPICIGESPRSMIGNGALYTMVGKPTEDTGTMIREIGAMVQDLQTRGDHAIEDWVIR